MSFISITKSHAARMGWTFKWVSVGDGDFNRDYGVSQTAEEVAKGTGIYNYLPAKSFPVRELPGVSVFYRDLSGHVFHTYSTYSRGLDMLNVAYHYLDIVPLGRQEGEAGGMDWVRRHDEYGDARAGGCH